MKAITRGNIVLYAFLANLLLSIVSFIPFLIIDKGMLSLGTDYDAIVLPLLKNAREAIWNGEIFWSWNFDLGTDFVGAYSFLALGSPFFWLSVLLPKIDYLYLGAILFILKYAFAGMTSAMYIKRFVNDNICIVIGSILYSFSGFQSINLMFGSFHDIVALFPLMLVGMEVMLTENKKGLFAISVCLNVLVNYYFFVGELIFLLIYFLIRFGLKNIIKNSIKCMCEGLIGIAMGSICFFPSIMFSLQNPRSQSIFDISRYIVISRRDILKLFRAFFFPGEMMQQWSCINTSDWTSCSAYLPMVGIILVISYVLGSLKKRNWLKTMNIIVTMFMLIPILNSVFTLMTDGYYRWYYMPLIIFSLASAKTLEENAHYPIKRVSVIIMLLLSLSIIFFSVWDKYKYQLIFIKREYIIINVLALLGVMLCYIFSAFYNGKNLRYLFFVGICLFSVGTTIYTITRYQDVRGYDTKTYVNKVCILDNLGQSTCLNQYPYRLASTDNIISSRLSLSGCGSSYNTVQGSIFSFWESIGEKRRVSCPPIPNGFYDLVGGRYYISKDYITKEGYILIDKYERENMTYYLFEKNDVRPIGYTYSFYILKDNLLKLSKDERVCAMQKAIVTEEGDLPDIVMNLQEYLPGNDNNIQQGIEDYMKMKGGFCCKIDGNGKNVLLFTIPYSQFWKCFINNEKVQIYNSNGFMVVPIENGENNIYFEYFNYHVLIGLIISLSGFTIWGIIIAKAIMDRRKNGQTSIIRREAC